MPNKKAAEKAFRQTKKHTAKNARAKTNIKALLSQFASFVKDGKKDEAKATFLKVQQAMAKAAREHIIHGNKAARKIGSAQKSLNTIK